MKRDRLLSVRTDLAEPDDLQEAKEIHEEVLEIREQVLKEALQDPNHDLLLDVLRSQSDYALTLVKLSKTKEAHEIQFKVFREYDKVGMLFKCLRPNKSV